MTSERISYCRICAAACGIVVTIDGSQVVKVRGDADHPASRGYTCAKGRGLPAWHHSPNRLDGPRLGPRPVPWADVLDDLARRLDTIVAEAGPDAVGVYLATGLAYDAAGQIAVPTWQAMLGSRSFYSATTVDNAPVLVAAELVAGNASLAPVWDPTGPGLLLLVGTNPAVSHGYGTTIPDPVRYLRGYRGTGGRIWAIDPRRHEAAALADEHLAVRPGGDVEVLGAVARLLLDHVLRDPDAAEATSCRVADLEQLRVALVPFTARRAAEAAGVDEDRILALAEDVIEHRGRVAILCGTGTTMSTDGVLVEWLRWVLLIVSGSLDRPGGMRFQQGVHPLRPPRSPSRPPAAGPASRPDLPRVSQQLPAVALIDEIEAGNLRALVVAGGNPITALPEPERTRAALARLDVLVVLDVAESELTTMATHTLAATGQLERADLTLAAPLAIRPAVQATEAVVPSHADRRPAWWIFSTLAARVGLDLLAGRNPDDCDDLTYLRSLLERSPVEADDLLAAGPHGLPLAVEHGWVRATMLPDGLWSIAPQVMLERLAARRTQHDHPPLVLAPRREMAWSNSVVYAGDGDEPAIHLHPDDAREAEVADGSRVELIAAHGTVRGVVKVDARVRRGVVSMTHGHRGGSPGALLSTQDHVDPLTTMPRASGVPVTLSRA